MSGINMTVMANKISPSWVSMASITKSASSQSPHPPQHALPTNRKLKMQLTRMLISMAVPVVGVIISTAVIFSAAKTRYDQSKHTFDRTGVNLAVGELVASIQRERGMTAMYLSSNGKNRDAFQRMLSLRQETDSRARAISDWLSTFAMHNTSLPDLEAFMKFVGNARSHFDLLFKTATENIKFFSDLNDHLIDWAIKSVEAPNAGQIKNLIVASDAVLLATEYFGQQRALASTFFTQCDFLPTDRKWFTMLEGSAISLMKIAFQKGHQVENDYKSYQNDIPNTMASYISLKSCVWNEDCIARCYNSTIPERYDTSFWWWANMTAYINMVHVTRKSIVVRINHQLNEVIGEARKEMIIYMSVMLLVSIGCIGVTISNALGINLMTRNIKRFAAQLSSKTKQLLKEQKRADELLCQMLPRQIADKLKQSLTIEAEFYDSVSIYFSDVVGFTDFASGVSPMLVVTMLNNLYCLFDECIDRYDVYKVETIGDAYMVVSGLPERNNMRHVTEIARLAIEIVDSVRTFNIPQLPANNFEIRVGIHTGSCVAGVVGSKMPRFCLFGDTVNTASRMESTGMAQKIHVSESTFALLSENNDFRLEKRGDIEIKGKGVMKTYWLSPTYEVRKKVLDPLGSTPMSCDYTVFTPTPVLSVTHFDES